MEMARKVATIPCEVVVKEDEKEKKSEVEKKVNED